VIVMLHVATGAALGRFVRSRRLAFALGFGLHLVEDAIPHEDTYDEPFEITTGLIALGVVAATRGLLDTATVGGAACCVPDAEHLVPLPRPGGIKLFHDGRGWHRSGGLSVRAQAALAGVLLVAVMWPRRLGRLPAVST
jgi:hypothetical protein